MGFAVGVVKYLVFIVNLIFVLFGLGIIIYGIVLSVQYNETTSLAPIVFGIIVFIIAFFGCCGAIKESRCMLITFAVILIVLFVISLIFGGIFIAVGSDDDNCTENVTTLYNNYLKNIDKQAWELRQTEYECCGLYGPADYKRSDLPPSCCKENKTECSKNNPDVFTFGCLFDCDITWLLYVLGVVVLIFSLIEITGAILAICLSESIRSQAWRRVSV